uniref:Uncharacterized protein n=1 Tax=Rangifer tarandus platyrhynchus TaxID=3082113 RepID=A0ACB0FLP1_RANTA|nr:unnamed protein product [Rangifer tarandus platyrhynchus]
MARRPPPRAPLTSWCRPRRGFPSSRETREAPSRAGGVSPPGAGTQLGAGRQVSSSSSRRPRGYTISSHKAEAPVRSGRGAGERKAGEGAERPRRRVAAHTPAPGCPWPSPPPPRP